MAKVNPIPAGYHTATPYLTLSDCAGAIEFYKKAFNAQEIVRMAGGPGGKIGHAELKIGDSMIMLADEMPGGDKSPKSLGGTTAAIFLYVPDVDATFQQALNSGANAVMPPTDMFWGDRFGKLTDPFGHAWAMATHKEDVAPAEMDRRMKEQMSQMPQKTKSAG